MSDFLAPAASPYLDSQATAFLEKFAKLADGKDITQVSIAELKRLIHEVQSPPNKPLGISISHHKIATSHGPVSTAIYRPKSIKDHVPIIYYLHGGGYISGDALDWQPLLFDIVERTECAVVFPQYTLAPAARFPTQQEQCLEVLQHVVDNAREEYRLDARKVAIASDSAGGQLSCAISILNHRQNLHIPIVHQVLFHPFIDSTIPIGERFSEYFFQNGPLITSGFVTEVINDYYIKPSTDTKDITASPLLMTIEQAKMYMPATTIVIAEEWLRDQAYDFMKLLQTAGVPCGAIETLGSFHDAEVFVGARDSPTVELSMIAVTGKLRSVLAQDTVKAMPRKRVRAE